MCLCGSGDELGQAEAQACRALLALAAAALDSRYMHSRLDITQHSNAKVLQRQNVIPLLLLTQALGRVLSTKLEILNAIFAEVVKQAVQQTQLCVMRGVGLKVPWTLLMWPLWRRPSVTQALLWTLP